MLLRFLSILLFIMFITTSSYAATSLMETIGGEKPVQLKSLNISTEISGSMAKTTVKMVFFNPNSRQLEGNLQFPLLDGQQMIGFALDIDGKMRPAVVIEKAKGRKIFEKIERKKADPALLEKTQGNNFKLRVYPIQGMGTRTVEIHYSEALKHDKKQYIYTLPLSYSDRLNDFNLSVKINGSNRPPKVISTLGKVKFSKHVNSYQAHILKSMYKPTGSLSLKFPINDEVQSYIQEHDGTAYFVSDIPVFVKPVARELPKVIGLLWDSSGSAKSCFIESEFAVLDEYFKAIGNAEIRLIRLRDHSEATQSFKIVNGNWDTLRESLKHTVYDGASALCDWKPQSDVNEYLLVSDGLSNYGSNVFPVLGSEQKLYALNSSLSADTQRLSALAQRNSGLLVQIDVQNPRLAIDTLLKINPKVDILSTHISDMFVDKTNINQGFIRLTGKLTGASNVVVVVEGKENDSTFNLTQHLSTHPLAARLWAGYKLLSLEENYELNRGEIRRIGMEFGIPTRETSLLVLDSVEDYVRYDVTPPQDLQNQYNELKKKQNNVRLIQKQSHLENVLDQFKAKIAWWEKAYPKDQKPKPKYENEPRPVETAMLMSPIMNYIVAPTAMPPRPHATYMAKRRSSDMPLNEVQVPVAEVGITLKKWKSDAPYIARMNEATRDTIYAVYLDEKPSYENSSAFFLDAADMLIEKGEHDLALRVLSNLVEMDLENRHVLRILGYRLIQLNELEMAIPIFEKVLRLSPEEPQSYRDLGLAYAASGRYQEAVNNLNEVVERPWDNRFAEVELIALAEMNAIIARANDHNQSVNVGRIDPAFLKNMPLDVRAVLTWDADNSDMDLWVTDPNGEKCYYANRITYQGGRMSRDFTGGYGPEEFSLRDAKPGKYRVEANFYGNRQQTVAGATTLQLKLTTNFGTNSAKDQEITLRLRESKDTVFVGEFEVK